MKFDGNADIKCEQSLNVAALLRSVYHNLYDMLSMLQVNARNLDKNSFWVNTREWQLEDDSIFKGLVENFASKAPGNYDLCLWENSFVDTPLGGHLAFTAKNVLNTHNTGSHLQQTI